MEKGAIIASYSLVAKSIKLLAAPVTLLIISKELSSEELAYYYTFFSLISMQQLAELGIGHTMKQYISHSYKFDGDIWSSVSKAKIKAYYKTTNNWFYGVSIFILFIVGISGYFYLNVSVSSINWMIPWFFLVLASALNTLITPMIILIDSTQNQEKVQQAKLISGLTSSVVLWLSLGFGFGLYSVGVSSFTTLLMNYILLNKSKFEIVSKLNQIPDCYTQRDILNEIWPLLSRVSIVWAGGFLFWNSFNLVIFGTLDAAVAGCIIFAFTLAKVGFGVAESMTQGQMTMFSNLITNNKQDEAYCIFNKYLRFSMLVILFGYMTFFAVWFIFPYLFIFDKMPSNIIMIQCCVYFFILLFKTLKNNYVRCYKVEPFVKTALFESVISPLLFYIGVLYFGDYLLIPSIVMISIMTGVTLYVGNMALKHKMEQLSVQGCL
ncbi:hypothetical protein QTO12_08390 [Vibrio owensii]|uniref:hypothetical protein n=1 Tax=Vibrio owensii TaxID=696485 RepID=UPI002F409478